MAIVGSAQVLIRPTFSNMQKDIRDELEGVGAEAGEAGGRSLGDRLATWGKRGAVVAGGAIAAVAGTALVKGFGRLQAIENAQATMRGLGHDAESVRQIMDNALDSVKGTAFGLGEAATVAASAVAAGIEPGEALTGHLSNVANTAAAAGTSMEEMGSIFNKAATQANGVQNDVISQLADRGIPIYQALADQMGVTAGEVFKLASEGKVDFETFAAAAEAASGTVAAEMGGTLTGSFQNTLAALGRVGANLLSGVYPYFAEFFQGAMDFLSPLEDKAVVVGEAIGKWMARAAEGVKTFIQEFREGEGLGGRVADVFGRVRDVAQTIGTWLVGTAIPAIASFGQWLVSIRGWLIPIGAGILAIVAAWKTYQAIMAIVRGVTVAFTAVQATLNAVMAMNPIGLVVLALVGLVAAFVVAYKNSETFRNVVTAAWEGIKSAASAVWDWLKQAFQWIKDGLSSVGKWFTDRGRDIQGAWNAMRDGISAGWSWIDRNVFTPIKTGVDLVKRGFDAGKDGVVRAWTVMRDGLKAGWDWVDRNVFQRFRDGLDTLVDWVRSGKDRIVDLWEGVKSAFATPINWVIRNAWNNGLLRAINAVARVIPGVSEISPLAEIRTRAKGGYTPPGWTLVGEEGPELVNFTHPNRVYTAEETRAMLAGGGLNPIQRGFSAGNPPHGGVGGWFSDRWDDVKSAGRWVADGVRDAAGNVVKWARGGLAKAAEIVLNPIRSLIRSSLGSGEGFLGDLLAGTGTMAIDKLLSWLRDEDEGAAPDSGGRSLRGAQPHVNNAAHALADAVGGIRTMQAFNQSMAGGHPRGLAVDFIDSVSKLNRLADVISGGGHFDNFNYMAWQARLWSPGRGWRPQGRGYGNDPQHRWHLHAEWYDQGGMLKPGMGMYANATGKPEPVLTAGQWRDISTLAARGAGGGPRRVVLAVGDREFEAYMSEVADGRITSATKPAGRRMRAAGVGG